MSDLTEIQTTHLDLIYTAILIRHTELSKFPSASQLPELTTDELVFLVAAHFRSQIYGEGYDGWLVNSGREFAEFLPLALAELGAAQAARLARLAAKAARETPDKSTGGAYDRLFWEASNDLDVRLWSFAKVRRDRLPSPEQGGLDEVRRWEERSRRLLEDQRKGELSESKGQGRSDGERFLAAARRGDLETVRELLDRDSSLIGATKERTDETALHIAAAYGRVEIVRLLIARGADVNAKAIDRFTPLTAARRSVPLGGFNTDDTRQGQIIERLRKAGGCG